jgi:Cysteine-rich secretory protein family
MPIKEKVRRSHHVAHKHEKRNKKFLKVYAPYIPMLLIVGCGFFMAASAEFKHPPGTVKSYATDISDSGLLEATNNVRTRAGLRPLKLDDSLDSSAQSKANDMSQHDYWSHISPGGQKPSDFISGYSYAKTAENLAYGFNSSKATINGWMNSSGHRANVLDPEIQDIGFGIVNIADYQGQGPQTLVVAFYGQPATLAGTEQASPATNEPKNISFAQHITGGNAPWSSLAIGIFIGSVTMYLTLTHARRLRKLAREGERFVIKHPLLDITLVALIALAAIASQTIGKIH